MLLLIFMAAGMSKHIDGWLAYRTPIPFDGGTIFSLANLLVFVPIFICNRKSLKFTEVKTTLPRKKLMAIMRKVEQHADYNVTKTLVFNEDIVVFEVYPSFGSSRRLLTVVFDEGRVLVSCIRRFKDSKAALFLGNAKSIRQVKEAIEREGS